jgi:exonuclease VII large subunit
VAHGYLSLYEAGGNYQFYVDEIQPAGRGQLHLEFELLKARLQQLGLAFGLLVNFHDSRLVIAPVRVK